MICVLDYKAGNVRSVLRALAGLGHEAVFTADPAEVARADRVIFPGVGAAGSCMENLCAAGLDDALRAVVAAGRPLLGICVGMQLLFEHSDEDGGVPCLGILPGRVVRFAPRDPACKVPHMGWNSVRRRRDDPLFAGVDDGTPAYFVHSYHCVPQRDADVLAEADHGGTFCATVRRGALVAVQFHPEKSGPAGLRLLDNFCKGRP